MISKEEIKRVDKAHARADEAIAQQAAGHIITECVVLFPDENDGEEVVWNREQLEKWPDLKSQMISGLARRPRTTVGIVLDEYNDHAGFTETPNDGYYAKFVKRTLVMYRQSAAYLAVHPAPDPYTKSDRAGLDT